MFGNITHKIYVIEIKTVYSSNYKFPRGIRELKESSHFKSTFFSLRLAERNLNIK